MPSGARNWYEDGVADHYREHGDTYRNPHAPIIDRCMELAVQRWPLKVDHVLDLAAGAGEFTVALERAVARRINVSSCDPFTGHAYEMQTGRPCLPITFEQIAAGELRRQEFSLIGCSFAMHLCPFSVLPVLLLELSQIARQLVILSPHKRPVIRDGWGWSLRDSFTEQRVHVRLLESTLESTTLTREP